MTETGYATVIVPFTEAARPFIMDTYVHSMLTAPKRTLAAHLLMYSNGRGLREWLSKCLEVGTCKLLVPLDKPDVYLGWALFRGSYLDFVYVKKDARKLGFGRDLVAGTKKCAEPLKGWHLDYAVRMGWL